MERSQMAVVAGVAGAVVVAGVGAAFVFGLVPGGGGDDVAPPTTGDGNGSEVTLNFTLVGGSECGQTCRVVNTTIRNTGNTSLNVTASHALFTRYENGSAKKEAWSGQVAPGTIAANETVVSTFEINVGIGDGLALRENDGLLFTTLQTDRGNETVETVVPVN
ncbi:hypothetical protein [Halorientalis pallida]|uniref:hypothetical protein n=1 Tax=Halorientalis pallida TaxID=2479928 RepID=UPI00187D1458|nr:hypothetical protein [Halorientalis pallida]